MQPYEFTPDESITFNRIINNIQNHMEMLSELPPSPHTHNRHHRLAYLHDVLEIHNCRNNPDFQVMYMQDDRRWNTEYDIPEQKYLEALTEIADEILRILTITPTTRISDCRKVRAVDQISLLFRLRMHRMHRVEPTPHKRNEEIL